jgi:hypothetical protein
MGRARASIVINRRALRLAAAYIETLRIRNLSSAALPLSVCPETY